MAEEMYVDQRHDGETNTNANEHEPEFGIYNVVVDNSELPKKDPPLWGQSLR
jgi:hypothetical protein